MLGFCKHLGLGMGLATAHNRITSRDSLCKWCKTTGGWSRAGGFGPTLQCHGCKGHKAPPPPPAAVPSHLTTAMSPTASRKPPCEGVHSSGHPARWSGARAGASEPLGHRSPKGHHVWKQSPQTPTASRALIKKSGEFQALHMVSLSSLLSCGRGSGRTDPTALGGLGLAAWLPPSRSPSGAGAGGAWCTWRASAPQVLGPCVCAGLSHGALGCQTRLRAPDGGQGGKCQPSLAFP